MKSVDRKTVTTSALMAFETVASAAIYIAFVILKLGCVDGLEGVFLSLSSNLFELNNSIVIALIISMIIGNVFSIKGRKMKRVARSAWLFIVINSIIIAAYPALGLYCIAIVIPMFVANLIKIFMILRDSLDVF